MKHCRAKPEHKGILADAIGKYVIYMAMANTYIRHNDSCKRLGKYLICRLFHSREYYLIYEIKSGKHSEYFVKLDKEYSTSNDAENKIERLRKTK